MDPNSQNISTEGKSFVSKVGRREIIRFQCSSTTLPRKMDPNRQNISIGGKPFVFKVGQPHCLARWTQIVKISL